MHQDYRVFGDGQRTVLRGVEVHVVDDEQTTGRECGEGFFEKLRDNGGVPIVENIREEMHIEARGQRLGKHIARLHGDLLRVAAPRDELRRDAVHRQRTRAIPLEQFVRAVGQVQTGIDEGAVLVAGGLGAPEGLGTGYYVRPTVFSNVKPGMTIEQEEIFGPVLSIIPYEDDDDAVRIANNSRYGLSGSVSSRSLDRALGVARRIRTGTVSVNGGQWFGPDSPFGGYKESGLGREHGVQGFEEYLETKTIGLPG